MSADQSVAVVLTRRVAVENFVAFEAILHELLQIAIQAPGHLGGDVLRGAITGGVRVYHVVYRFADATSLAAWEMSKPRTELAAKANALAMGATRQELSGMEAWFDVPGEQPPPRSRMAFLTFIGIWPTVCFVIYATGPVIGSTPFIIRNGIVAALAVALMTYVVMPRLAKWAMPWLVRR
jgi:antibiotic biosynthesis monooxygenase (ABM) superfamily enzyme